MTVSIPDAPVVPEASPAKPGEHVAPLSDHCSQGELRLPMCTQYWGDQWLDTSQHPPGAHEGWAGWQLVPGRRCLPVSCWDLTSQGRALSCGRLSARSQDPAPGPVLPPQPAAPVASPAPPGPGQSRSREEPEAAQPSAPDTLRPSTGQPSTVLGLPARFPPLTSL